MDIKGSIHKSQIGVLWCYKDGIHSRNRAYICFVIVGDSSESGEGLRLKSLS